MQASAVIESGKFKLRTKLSPLQAAEVAGSKYGFFDVDLKDNDPGQYTIKATAHNRTLTSRGKTLEEAVDKFLEALGDSYQS